MASPYDPQSGKDRQESARSRYRADVLDQRTGITAQWLGSPCPSNPLVYEMTAVKALKLEIPSAATNPLDMIFKPVLVKVFVMGRLGYATKILQFIR
jgi:hypothetical protein